MVRTLIVAVVLAATVAAPSLALAGKAFEADHTSGRMLLDYLDHPDWRFRLDAADEIADRKIAQAKPKLEELAAHDPNDRVRLAALEALTDEFGGPDDRGVLHAILRDAGEDLRSRVVRMIEKAPHRDDRGALIDALTDPEPDVSRHAARALVRLGDRSVAPILRDKALDTTHRKVAEELNEAAARLGG